MAELISIVTAIGGLIWLISLQERISGLRFSVSQLEKKLKALSADKSAPANQQSQALPAAPQTAPAAKATPNTQTAPLWQPAAIHKTPVLQASVPAAAPKPQAGSSVNTEPASDFTVVKLFSWLGGFMLLLGIIFWIKYAIENDLISPELRIALSITLGAGLWVAGALLKKPSLKTTSHTLLASGLCICYAAWFSAFYFYQMLGQNSTFILLGLTALAAFGTAVWKRTQYIGFLAQIIGFLTPFLFSSAEPNLLFLLAYFAFINTAAAAAAIRCKWDNQLFSSIIITTCCLLAVMNGMQKIPSGLHIFMSFTLFFGMLYGAAAVWLRKGELLLAAGVATALVQFSYMSQFLSGSSALPLAGPFVVWAAVLFIVLAGIPFVFKERFLNSTAAWAYTAISGGAACTLICVTFKEVFEWSANGATPLLFAVLYGAAAAYTLPWQALTEKVQRVRLAWLCSASALFLALAITLQFEHQWMTVALAAEACALIWLNLKLKLEALPVLGNILFVLTCVLLVFNFSLFNDYQSGMKIFNWYLLTYGVAAGFMFAARRACQINANDTSAKLLGVLGGVTLFTLLNVEIADYFSTGSTLEMNLVGDWAQAAVYTVAWVLSGAGCLFAALKTKNDWLKKAGLGLVGLALAKLFLADIWSLGTGARILVLIIVAIILMGVSFAYQQFRTKGKTPSEPPVEK